MEEFFKHLMEFVQRDEVLRILSAGIVLLLTFLLSVALVRIVRSILHRDDAALPDISIFLNLVRGLVWLVGIGFMLYFCFSINVSAIITALGVGGIAVSLGFQATIANLIGGLTVSFARIVKPGDNIMVGSEGVTGIVQDVTWHHTAIKDDDGDTILVPNSVMNSTALIVQPPLNEVSIPIVVTASSIRLTTLAHHMEDAAKKVIRRVSKLKKGPRISFSEINEFGFVGSLNYTISEVERVDDSIDAAIRAIAPFVHGALPADAPVPTELIPPTEKDSDAADSSEGDVNLTVADYVPVSEDAIQGPTASGVPLKVLAPSASDDAVLQTRLAAAPVDEVENTLDPLQNDRADRSRGLVPTNVRQDIANDTDGEKATNADVPDDDGTTDGNDEKSDEDDS